VSQKLEQGSRNNIYPYCENDHKKERMWPMSAYYPENNKQITETYYWCHICGKKKNYKKVSKKGGNK
jgi:hypothetical protein